MKLTNYVREDIRDKALRHKYEEVIPALIVKSAEVARAAYDRLYDEATQKKMRALPDGWLDTDDDIQVNVGGQSSSLDFNGRILQQEIEDLARQTMVALKTVTTAKRLVETWPEIARYVDYEIKPPLPAIPVEQLNERLGLEAAA